MKSRKGERFSFLNDVDFKTDLPSASASGIDEIGLSVSE